MLWPILALAGFGFVVASKAKPKTTLNKMVVLGPRSGETWDAEVFPDAGLVVVMSRRGDKTVASFVKVPADPSGSPRRTAGYVFKQSKGLPLLIAMMREDFEGEKPPV